MWVFHTAREERKNIQNYSFYKISKMPGEIQSGGRIAAWRMTL